jgi:O-antigen/teichoic acid export membrane protein
MRSRFLHNFSFTSLQLLVNQLLGMVMFFLLAEGLSKQDFGELNWSLSIFLTLFLILSFGIDQITVRKIASGAPANSLLWLYLVHVLCSGLLFYGSLLVCRFIFPSFFTQHSLLLALGAGKLLFYFSTPFKQIAAGLEQFQKVFYMSLAASASKAAGVVVLQALQALTIHNVVLLFVVADAVELLTCIAIGRHHLTPPCRPSRKDYRALLNDSVHQFGTSMFAAAIARMDWIFIGLFLSSVHLADYSFAYKAFELANLPLLAIAPVLVPLLTRSYSRKEGPIPSTDLMFLLKIELMIAALVALLLNIGWEPLVAAFTSGQYGAVNSRTIFILSLAMPVLYLNNFLWSLHFALGRTRMIFYTFAVSFVVNLALVFMLIPVWGNEGAALAYLLTMVFQTFLYLLAMEGPLKMGWQPLVFCFCCAFASGIIIRSVSLNHWLNLPISLVLYIGLLVLTLQLRPRDWRRLKRVMSL